MAYAEAGADAILIHSKDKTLAEIEGFLEEWRRAGLAVPLVAVPTLFPDYSSDQLKAKGFSMVILANHPMRAAVKAMQETLARLRPEGRALMPIPHIAKVDEIFELVHTRETIEAEEADELV